MKIRWSEPAVSDLENIKNYIANDSEVYACEIVERIINAVEKLYCFPEMGRKVPEADNPSIREIIFLSYRIIYRVQEDTVTIITILHGARDITRMTPSPWEIV